MKNCVATTTGYPVHNFGGIIDQLYYATKYYSAEKPDGAKWEESENWWHFDDETGEVVEWKRT